MGRRGLLWAVIGCALLLHGAFLAQRWALEKANDTVEIALDYDSVRVVAEQSGVPASELLRRWTTLGVTSVALGGFVEEGVEEGPPGVISDAVPGGGTLSFDTAVPGPSSDEEDRQLVAEVVDAVGRVVPRTVAAAREAAARGLAVGPYIPRGETVEGYPDDVAGTATVLSELGLSVGIVEFADARGRSDLIGMLDYDGVLVHSIPAREFVRLSDEQAVRRFYRAVFERQARLLYVHLRHGPAADPATLVERNSRYISDLVHMVSEAGLSIGPATPVPRGRTPGFVVFAAALAAGAALLLVMERFGSSARGWGDVAAKKVVQRLYHPGVAALLAAGPAFVAFVLTVAGRDVLARQGIALAVAVVFPLLAVASVAGMLGVAPFAAVSSPRRGDRGGAYCKSLTVVTALSALAVVVALGFVGAALTAGTLGDVRFMMKLHLFRGVKLAHGAPLAALVGWWLAGTAWTAEHPEVAAAGVGATDRGIGPVRRGGAPFRMSWWTPLAALFVSAAAFVLIARTGHDLLPVSAAERAVREWLESALPVRPRTKEFVLGYPALVVSIWLAIRGAKFSPSGPEGPGGVATGPWGKWAGLFLVAGAVVPISIVNTFAHVHISLAVSVVRSLLGLLTGSAVGLAAVAGGVWLQRAFAAGRRSARSW